MFTCRVKFDEKGRIACCSQTECKDCKDKDSCEVLDMYIHGPYEDVGDCMKARRYKRVNGRLRQK